MRQPALAPWEIHPALSEERLRDVARIVWDARASAARDAKWTEGDGLWDIGCRAYVRTRHALVVSSMSLDWLSVSPRSHRQFVFRVGGVPVRFYRGDPETGVAPERYAAATEVELASLQEAFALFDTPTPDAYFRLVVTTDPKGFPVRVSLTQVNARGEIQNPWRIPSRPAESIPDIAHVREEAVPLPPPPVGDDVRRHGDDPRRSAEGK